MQTRNVKCQEVEGKVMNESFCAGLEQPPTERECWDDRRSKCTPLWHEGEFGEVRWFGNNQDTVLPPPQMCDAIYGLFFQPLYIVAYGFNKA